MTTPEDALSLARAKRMEGEYAAAYRTILVSARRVGVLPERGATVATAKPPARLQADSQRSVWRRTRRDFLALDEILGGPFARGSDRLTAREAHEAAYAEWLLFHESGDKASPTRDWIGRKGKAIRIAAIALSHGTTLLAGGSSRIDAPLPEVRDAARTRLADWVARLQIYPEADLIQLEAEWRVLTRYLAESGNEISAGEVKLRAREMGGTAQLAQLASGGSAEQTALLRSAIGALPRSDTPD